ncbi:MAG: response regulator [Coriobacteriia bacterium]|nr:response regulator [Coriobacteriia bacterium]
MAILILVVDDDSEMTQMMSIALREFGFDVVSAPDAETAHAVLHGVLPDAVLLDVAMPRMDGFELLSEWRRAGIVTPVLLHTAYNTPEVRERAATSGADDLVFKPTSIEVIAAKLHMAVDSGQPPPS